MDFQVGDKVIHWTYGLGEIVQFDEKVLAGLQTRCYVVRIRDLTLWVPTNGNGQSSLRMPTPKEDFEKLFTILGSPGETLSSDRNERKLQLVERLHDGKIETICQVIRDLSQFSRSNKTNDVDKSLLERAKSILLNEWGLAMSVSPIQAEQELNNLLGD